MTDERGEDEAGWAVPDLASRAPQSATGPPPAPGAPPPPGAAAPPGPPGPTGSWSLTPPPGAMPPGVPAPPRKRRGWIVVLVAMLATILGFTIAGTVLFVDSTLPVYQGAQDFMTDFLAGDERAAIAGLCAADRDDPDAAFSAVARQLNIGDEVTVDLLGVDRDGDRGSVEITSGPSGSGSESNDGFDLPMREEDGEWKACPGDLGLR